MFVIETLPFGIGTCKVSRSLKEFVLVCLEKLNSVGV